jgi:hypothetical protein
MKIINEESDNEIFLEFIFSEADCCLLSEYDLLTKQVTIGAYKVNIAFRRSIPGDDLQPKKCKKIPRKK